MLNILMFIFAFLFSLSEIFSLVAKRCDSNWIFEKWHRVIILYSLSTVTSVALSFSYCLVVNILSS